MGSIIQATPLLQTLKKNFPEAEIIFITSNVNRKLLESIGVIDKIFDIQDHSFTSIIRTSYLVLRSLWEKKPDLYIDLEAYSYFSTALATMSCSRNRFGFYRVERNIRMGVYTHMMFFNTRAPIAHSYLQMARLAGCKVIIEKLYPFIITESDRMSCRRKLATLTGKVQGNFIILNPNASDLRVERRWPAKYFIELIHNLHSLYPDKIFFLIGSADEFTWVNSIFLLLNQNTRDRVFNTAGLFTLYELFALIEISELVISNDTGPMHISFALEKPTVSLFGPASPSQYGQNSNAFGVYKNIYCSPCVHDFLTPPCRGDNQCMKQITVNEVEQLCRELLSAEAKEGKIISNELRFLKNDSLTSLGIVERGSNSESFIINVEIQCACCGGNEGCLVYRKLTSIYSNHPWNIAECIVCKNIITLPVASGKLLEEIYSKNYHYDVHLLTLDEKKFRSVEMAKFIRKNYQSNKNKHVFEIGCMYGYLLEELKNDFTVSGIEIGKVAVNFCNSHGLDVKESSIENYLSTYNEKFDLIILSHVFEHLLSPEIILEKLSDRLNHDGKIIISVPNSNSFFRKMFGRNWGWWQVPVHINHFRESAIRKLAEQKGMKVEIVRYKGGDSLMILLNFINLFRFRSKNSPPGPFQKNIIKSFSFILRYWYFLGNEELTVVLTKE